MAAPDFLRRASAASNSASLTRKAQWCGRKSLYSAKSSVTPFWVFTGTKWPQHGATVTPRMPARNSADASGSFAGTMMWLSSMVIARASSDQIIHIHFEGGGNALENAHRCFPRTALQLRKIRFADACLLGKLCLRQSPISAPTPDWILVRDQSVRHLRRNELLRLRNGAVIGADILEIVQAFDHAVISLLRDENETLALTFDGLVAHS